MNSEAFAAQLRDGVPGGWAEMHASNWEHSRVELVLKRYGLQGQRPQVVAAHERLTQERRLSFAAFAAEFPDFPLFLGAAYAPRLEESELLLLPALLTKFEKSPLAKLYDDFVEEFGHAAETRPCGLIVNRRGLAGGMLVLPGDWRTRVCFELSDTSKFAELVCCAPADGRRPARAYCVCAFSPALAAVQWGPA